MHILKHYAFYCLHAARNYTRQIFNSIYCVSVHVDLYNFIKLYCYRMLQVTTRKSKTNPGRYWAKVTVMYSWFASTQMKYSRWCNIWLNLVVILMTELCTALIAGMELYDGHGMCSVDTVVLYMMSAGEETNQD